MSRLELNAALMLTHFVLNVQNVLEVKESPTPRLPRRLLRGRHAGGSRGHDLGESRGNGERRSGVFGRLHKGVGPPEGGLR